MVPLFGINATTYTGPIIQPIRSEYFERTEYVWQVGCCVREDEIDIVLIKLEKNEFLKSIYRNTYNNGNKTLLWMQKECGY